MATETATPTTTTQEGAPAPATLGTKPVLFKPHTPKPMPKPSMLLKKVDKPAEKPEKPAAAATPEPETDKPQPEAAAADKPEVKGDESTATKDTATEDKPKNEGHNFDKGLQKVQQQVSRLGDIVKTLADKIDQQGGKPTEVQKDQIQTAQDQIDDLKDLLDRNGETFLEEKDGRRLAQKLVKLEQDMTALRADRDRLERESKATREAKEADAAYWQTFKEQNPELDGQEKALMDLAAQRLTEEGEDPASPDYAGAARIVWKQVVKEAKAAAKAKAEADAESKKRKPAPTPVPPPSTKPDKSPVGASTLLTSAARTQETAKDRLTKARSALVRRV